MNDFNLIFGNISDALIAFTASFLIWLMYFSLIYFFISQRQVYRKVVISAFVAGIIAYFLSEFIKNIFPTLRPFYINGYPPLTLTIPSDSAFPSGHAAMSFALAITIWLHHKRLGLFYIIIALVICIGRIISNVHFFSDVLGGLILGSFVALVIDSLHLGKLKKRSKYVI